MKTIYTILGIISAFAVVTAVSIAVPAFADKPSENLEKKDEKIHDKDGFVSEKDIKFHEKTCFPPEFGGTFPDCPK